MLVASNNLNLKDNSLLWIERIAEFLTNFWPVNLPSGKKSAFCQKIASVTLFQMSRPGWPGALIPSEQKSGLYPSLEKLATPLFYSCDTPIIREFSCKAAKAIILAIPTSRLKSHRNERYLRSKSGMLKHVIQKELLQGSNQKQAAMRAAKAVYNTKTIIDEEQELNQARTNNKLKPPILGSHSAQSVNNDIRWIIERLVEPKSSVQKSAFASLLTKSSVFEAARLQKALGKALWNVCRPLGFLDPFGQILLAEVPSSSAAHEISFRKMELITKLKTLSGFDNLRDIRFRVTNIRTIN